MQNESKKSTGEVVAERRQALGLTQAALAREAGTKQQTIDKIEKGTIKHSRVFPRLAVALKVPLDTLLPDAAAQGTQQAMPSAELSTGTKDLPVHAAAQGGPGEMIVSSDPVDWVLRPDPLSNVKDAYGIIIVGESMLPEFRPGDIALVNPHLPPMREETYIFYAEENGEIRATIKHLIKWTDANWHVRQWNAPKGQKPDITLSRREWGKLHRVVGKYSR